MDLGSKRADPDHQPLRHRHRAGLERRRQHACTSPPTAAASRRSTRSPAGGGGATRVTFQGSYNASATVSADGKKIAMAQGGGNATASRMMDRSFGAAALDARCRRASLDESPSFAPNGSMMLYAAREGRRGVLYAVSADGRVRQRLVLADGDVREPAWGRRYRQQR